MAVQAQFGGRPYGGGLAEEQLQALLSAAAGNKHAQAQYHCAAGVASAAQSELTCNGGVVASRKRRRDGDLEAQAQQYHQHAPVPSSSAALLPIPGVTMMHHKPLSASAAGNIIASGRTATTDSAAAPSTSGRGVVGPLPTAFDAVVAAELLQQGAEVDALVRAGCERLRLGLERATKRQCESLARAAALSAARALRDKERELEAARARAQELEERLRQAAAETQAWCGLARSNEADASGLRATLDALLLRAGGGCGRTAQHVVEQEEEEEGFGESPAGGGTDDAESCCFVDDREARAEDWTPAAAKWACRGCGAGEASVLVLPCRHLCLCKACEPRADACPVCLGAKNAAIHVEPN